MANYIFNMVRMRKNINGKDILKDILDTLLTMYKIRIDHTIIQQYIVFQYYHI